MSPLLLYYNMEPDGLLGATLLTPPTAVLIHSGAGPGTNAAGLGTLPALPLPKPLQCGNPVAYRSTVTWTGREVIPTLGSRS